MKRELVAVAALWAGLTALGGLAFALVDPQPSPLSDKGEEISSAFRFLLFAAVPVFALVVAVLLYSLAFHRSKGEPQEDGPPFQGRGAIPLAWLAVTSGLTLLIMIYPGLVGIPKIFGHQEPDLLVRVEAVQFAWLIEYPQQDVRSLNELVLPVDRNVRFEVTSRDVIHSFWIPAFMVKVDAVPGRVTKVTVQPTDTGSFDMNPLLRLQCAELCGLAHSRMAARVSVVTAEEFEQWVAMRQEEAGEEGGQAEEGGLAGVVLEIAAEGNRFDREVLEASAGQPLALRLDNRDPGVVHNVAVYTDESGAQPLFVGEVFPGPEARTYQVPPLEPGSYIFRCDVHPTTMTGTLVAR